VLFPRRGKKRNDAAEREPFSKYTYIDKYVEDMSLEGKGYTDVGKL
jgi:hypothetical protein